MPVSSWQPGKDRREIAALSEVTQAAMPLIDVNHEALPAVLHPLEAVSAHGPLIHEQ
jgi:hypothetical protein